MRRRPIRQWIVLTCLALGLAGSAYGGTQGQPNSWVWFIAGAAIGALVGLASWALRRPQGAKTQRTPVE